MGYPQFRAAIKKMLENEVLDMQIARDIVRKSGVLGANAGGGGTGGPITVIRAEYWNHYDGTSLDPISGDSYSQGNASDFPTEFSNIGRSSSYMFLERFTQVRITAKMFETHPITRMRTGWRLYNESSVHYFHADTAEPTQDLVTGEDNPNTQVYCNCTEIYNESGWIDIHPSWFNQHIAMRIEWVRDVVPDIDIYGFAKIGVCELQLR